MRAGLGLVGVVPQGSSDGVRRIAVIVEDEVGVAAFAAQPAIDLGATLFDRDSHSPLGRFTIGPGGGSGNIAFVTQALAKLIVGAADMLAKRVAPGGLVLQQVTRWARRSGCFLRGNREVGLNG